MKQIATLVALGLLVLTGASLAQAEPKTRTILQGAPSAIVRLVNASKMPQAPVSYSFQWATTCGNREALGCTTPLGITLDPLLLHMGQARVTTGIGKGVPVMTFILFHELGHIFDRVVMTDAARAQFMSLIGRTDWWASAIGPSAGELFADAYSLCSVYGATIPHDTQTPVGYGWMPTATTYAASCGIILDVVKSVTPS